MPPHVYLDLPRIHIAIYRSLKDTFMRVLRFLPLTQSRARSRNAFVRYPRLYLRAMNIHRRCDVFVQLATPLFAILQNLRAGARAT